MAKSSDCLFMMFTYDDVCTVYLSSLDCKIDCVYDTYKNELILVLVCGGRGISLLLTLYIVGKNYFKCTMILFMQNTLSISTKSSWTNNTILSKQKRVNMFTL